MKNYRWGIIGPGRIAEKFATALAGTAGASLEAVASRENSRAKAFAEKHGAARFYDSYEQLAADPAIDAIYVATPHAFHCAQTLLCLENQKPVLCEKPMALSHLQVQQMVSKAREKNIFLMEAMWTRFIPATLKALELIDQGKIGAVQYVRGDFGFGTPFDPNSRLYNMQLGGGTLLDIGVYPLFLCLLLLGEPAAIKATANLAATGADETCQAMFSYHDGRFASILSTVSCQTPTTAEICGTEGIIYLPQHWYRAESLTLRKNDGEVQEFQLPHEVNGFEYQIKETMECLDKGLIESPRMTHQFSLTMSKIMDAIRQQCGIVYPGE